MKGKSGRECGLPSFDSSLPLLAFSLALQQLLAIYKIRFGEFKKIR